MFGLGWGWPVAAALALIAVIGLFRILLGEIAGGEKTPGEDAREEPARLRRNRAA